MLASVLPRSSIRLTNPAAYPTACSTALEHAAQVMPLTDSCRSSEACAGTGHGAVARQFPGVTADASGLRPTTLRYKLVCTVHGTHHSHGPRFFILGVCRVSPLNWGALCFSVIFLLLW